MCNIIVVDDEIAARELIVQLIAGLSEKFGYLKEEYEKETNIKNPFTEKLPFNPYGIEMINAGDYIDGENGTAYYDIDNSPTAEHMYDGTGVTRLVNIGSGEWTQYDVQIHEDGNYMLILMATSSSDNAALNIYVDGDKIFNSSSIKNTGGYYYVKPEFNELGTVYLKKGTHRIKVEQGKTGASVHCFGLLKQTA